MNGALEDLGRTVAIASDRSADPKATLRTARARWLAAPPRRRRPAVRVAALGLAAALLTLAALLALSSARQRVATWGQPAPVSFSVGATGQPGVTGEWLGADARPVALRFSEGTTVTLGANARARVAAVSADGAELVLEQGTLRAAVVHRSAATRWAVRGGPFAVRVVGTAFTVAWDSTAERFELTVSDGAVEVSGPHLPEARSVVAGERLVVEVRSGQMHLWRADRDGAAASAETRLEAAPPEPVDAAAAPASAATPDPARGTDGSRRAAPVAWREPLERGAGAELIGAIDRAGVGAVMGAATPAELWKIADAARFARRPDVASAALVALRDRHGVRGASAFLLGKIAADQQGSPAAAIRWFEAYLREAPNGPLAEEAYGRLMLLERRAQPASASATATKYLARFPNGAYSELARSLRTP